MVNPIAPNAANLPATTTPGNQAAAPQGGVTLSVSSKSATAATENAQQNRKTDDATTSTPDAIDNLNQSLEAWSTGLRFEMNEEAQRLVVSIVDSTTGETVRQIPSEAVLHVAKMIVQMQGQSINTKA